MDRAEPRPEPRGLTLPDLLSLIVGSAFALSLRDLAPPYLDEIVAVPVVLWWMKASPIVQLVPAWCAIALGTAILVRQARYRRAARSLEWGALPASAWIIARWLIGRFGPRDFARFADAAWIGLGASLAGLAALAALRRILPAWAKTLAVALLLAVFLGRPWWYGIARDGWSLFEEAYARWVWQVSPARWSDWTVMTLLNVLPFHLPTAIPAVAAVRDLRRGGRGRAWTEWAGLGVLVVGLVLAVANEGVRALEKPPARRAEHLATVAGAMGLMAAVAYGAIVALGPAWANLMNPPPRPPAE